MQSGHLRNLWTHEKLMFDLPFKTGQIVDDRYQIVDLIGSGGMGTIYKAEEIELARIVALKFLQLHSGISKDQDNLARFSREGQVLSKLSHANIARIYRAGVWKGKYPYIAMEYVEGVSLRELLDETGKLDWQQAIHIVAQIADGLAFAHACGVVHRDIKPTNVILSPSREHVTIVDFGLASIEQDSQIQKVTQTGQLVGSVFYMSPEQCQGAKADARSDLYSLGCMLYECLAGRPPFLSDNPISLLDMHVNTKACPLALAGVYPPDLESVVFKAIAKEPADRYQSMLDFNADLRHMKEGQPVEVAAPSVCGESTLPLAGIVATTLLALIVVALAFVMEFGKDSDAVSVLTRGHLGEAEEAIDKGKSALKSNRESVAIDQFSKAISLLKICKEQASRSFCDALAERGRAKSKLGHLSEADQDLQEAERLANTKDYTELAVKICLYRADVLSSSTQSDAAMKVLEHMFTIGSEQDKAFASIKMADILGEKKQLAEADRYYQQGFGLLLRNLPAFDFAVAYALEKVLSVKAKLKKNDEAKQILADYMVAVDADLLRHNDRTGLSSCYLVIADKCLDTAKNPRQAKAYADRALKLLEEEPVTSDVRDKLSNGRVILIRCVLAQNNHDLLTDTIESCLKQTRRDIPHGTAAFLYHVSYAIAPYSKDEALSVIERALSECERTSGVNEHLHASIILTAAYLQTDTGHSSEGLAYAKQACQFCLNKGSTADIYREATAYRNLLEKRLLK